eukprot:GHVL01023461.1.p1 GENE.GHVL01023461.1~~GHVL01023461.1.p1  ORF type:complete len:572 (+),score=82.03 GHVL01023461.1:96-1811(+)
MSRSTYISRDQQNNLERMKSYPADDNETLFSTLQTFTTNLDQSLRHVYEELADQKAMFDKCEHRLSQLDQVLKHHNEHQSQKYCEVEGAIADLTKQLDAVALQSAPVPHLEQSLYMLRRDWKCRDDEIAEAIHTITKETEDRIEDLQLEHETSNNEEKESMLGQTEFSNNLKDEVNQLKKIYRDINVKKSSEDLKRIDEEQLLLQRVNAMERCVQNLADVPNNADISEMKQNLEETKLRMNDTCKNLSIVNEHVESLKQWVHNRWETIHSDIMNTPGLTPLPHPIHVQPRRDSSSKRDSVAYSPKSDLNDYNKSREFDTPNKNDTKQRDSSKNNRRFSERKDVHESNSGRDSSSKRDSVAYPSNSDYNDFNTTKKKDSPTNNRRFSEKKDAYESNPGRDYPSNSDYNDFNTTKQRDSSTNNRRFSEKKDVYELKEKDDLRNLRESDSSSKRNSEKSDFRNIRRDSVNQRRESVSENSVTPKREPNRRESVSGKRDSIRSNGDRRNSISPHSHHHNVKHSIPDILSQEDVNELNKWYVNKQLKEAAECSSHSSSSDEIDADDEIRRRIQESM